MKKFIQLMVALVFLSGMGMQAMAQCTNSSSFGSATIASNGTTTTISTCSFGGEYSTINGAVSGQTLRFTSDIAGGTITIHSGTPSGPVIAFGSSPLVFANGFTGTIYAHWNLAGCGSDANCHVTTVQCTSCVPAPGQCTFTSSFGSATINPFGLPVVISTCSFAGEYSTISGAVSGQTLLFTSSAGDYVTLHSGSPSGPVIGFGPMPFSFNNTFTGTIFAHWSLNSSCATQSTCRTTTVQCTSCLPPPAPANDLCSGAITVSCPSTVSGNTTTATPDNLTAPTCVTTVGTGGGVWYKVVGTGGFINASTCSAGTDYDTKLSVYTGSCTGLVCVTGNDDDPNCTTGPGVAGFKSKVTWCAAQGQTYWILVHGFDIAVGNFSMSLDCTPPAVAIDPLLPQCSNGGPVTLSANFPGGTFSGPGVSGNTFNPSVAGVGTHTITYTVCSVIATLSVTVSAPPSNDLCSGALPLACNSSVTGSTTCAGVDGGLPFCGTTGGTAGGVWYTFTGNGSFVKLSTCNATTNYDTKLHVFTGSNCSGFTCVAGNDDYFSTTQTCNFSGLSSVVNFCTTPGQTYYVLVHGFSTAAGNYQLDMSCNAPLAVEAGACQTRFVGYTGPGAPDDTLYICPTVTGGSAPYTVTISPAAAYRCDNGCFAVAPSATTTYTISVTDGNGCTTSDNVVVNYLNVVTACGSNGQPKVQICHVPPGNPGNANTLCISPNAVPAHIVGGHGGDYFGPCGNPCRATNPACSASTCSGGSFTVTISGVGFLDETTWSLGGTTGGPYAFGSTNSTTVNISSGLPATFTIETQGTFNDNVANYTITCNGAVVTSGTINGGLSNSVSGICCGGMIAPKMGEQPQAALSTGGIMAFPNPFNDLTTFRFRSAKNGTASITLFTLAGKEVTKVFDGTVKAEGLYEVPFNAQGLSSGVYLYRFVNADGQMSMGKVNLVR